MNLDVKHEFVNRYNECDILTAWCNEDIQIVNDPYHVL